MDNPTNHNGLAGTLKPGLTQHHLVGELMRVDVRETQLDGLPLKVERHPFEF